MNIWLKTSGNRSSSRFNTSLPTIREQKNLSEDLEDDCEYDSITNEENLLNSRIGNYQNKHQKKKQSSTSNKYQIESYDQMKIQPQASKKSVRFTIDFEESHQDTRRPYQLDENQDDTVSEVPTHVILDKDQRLKFKHIKKESLESYPKIENTSNLKSNESLRRSRLTYEEQSRSNKKSTDQSLKRSIFSFKQQNSSSKPTDSALLNSSSSSVLYSKVPQLSSRIPSFQLNKGGFTSTSRSSMTVNFPQTGEDDWSALRSRRELSGGKTTGRKNIKQHIISIIQYCSNEVGLAVYNTSNGQIYLCQIIERLTYFRTISTIQRFYPIEIIYSSSLEHTPLIKQLLFKFRNIVFKSYKRMMFDETKGFHIYSQRGNKDDYNPDNKFIAYSALNALIFYLENNLETKFNYNSLSIKWHVIEDLLIIESQTISELEIFINAETKNKQNCFIENFICLTYGGTRMLRANLLQPLANEQNIKQRQELLSLLLQNKQLYDILVSEVQKFKNFEIITAKFIQSPKEKNMKSLKSFIFSIYNLSRHCLLIKKFCQKIEPYKDINLPILAKLLKLLNDHRITELKEFIEDTFDEEILKSFDTNKPAKKENFIFLFKAEKIQDDFIEVLRITYSHTTQDILRIFKKIKEKSNLDLKLLNSEVRGYYLKSNKKINLSILSQQIEDDIIQITQRKDSISFSTTILLSLNNRLKESEKKLILLCENLLQSIIFEIQKNTDVLFELNFQLSVLDMILSFAGFIKHYQGVKFTKPEIQVNSKCMKVQELKTIWTYEAKSRLSNPIDLDIPSEKKAIVFQKQSNSFEQLNLLYSIGYLTILTQIGCFVPALHFTTDLYQTVLSKINISENIQTNFSHFQIQLHHFKNIIDNSSHYNNNCLILLDELIKGTEYEEEISISQALLTHLIKIKGKTFVLLSDKFQLNFMIKIGSAPSLINSAEQQQQLDEEAIKVLGKSKIDSRWINSERSPFYFMLISNQQPLQKALKELNFSPQFVSKFQQLAFQDQDSN